MKLEERARTVDNVLLFGLSYTQKRKPLFSSGFCRLVMLRCVGDSNGEAIEPIPLKKSAGRSPSNKSLSYRLNPSYVRVPLPNVSRRQNLAERGVLGKMLLSLLIATYTQKRKPLEKSGFCRLAMLRCVGDSNP